MKQLVFRKKNSNSSCTEDYLNLYLETMTNKYPYLLSEEEEIFYGFKKLNVKKELMQILANSIEIHYKVQEFLEEIVENYNSYGNKIQTRLQKTGLRNIIYEREKLYKKITKKTKKKKVKKNYLKKLKKEYADLLINTDFNFYTWSKIREFLIETPSNKQLTKKKERVNKLYKTYKEIEELFVCNNWKWVVSIAKRYRKKNKSLSLMELIQEGNIGLMKAFEKYNPKLGYKFITYATWWIKQSMSIALREKTKIVRVQRDMIDELEKLKKEREIMIQQQERIISINEVIDEKVQSKIFRDNLKKTIIALAPTSSINKEYELKRRERLTLAEVLEDKNQKCPEETINQKLLIQKLQELLLKLNKRDREILLARFGINTGKKKTLEQISKEQSLCKERIRQIENKSLKFLQEKFSDEIF